MTQSLVSITKISAGEFDKWATQIDALEKATYEPSRQDEPAKLKAWVTMQDGLGLLAIDKSTNPETLLGYAFGGPLESSDVDGPKQDVLRTQNNTFYSVDLLVSAKAQGHGLGFRLKQAQIQSAKAMRNSEGEARYQ